MANDNKDNPYVALARKYRPQNFDDLLGQDSLVQTLTNAIKNNRLHHAYILTGIRGVGKTTTARIIARALNCIGKDGHGGPTIKPCGICENCKAIAQDRHIDVLELDAASRTGVDDMREILEGVRFKPTNARYKVYIIDEVHMLSKNAFNALLKTLEEPPSHVKFIFATTEIRKVPVTVLSRCQRFDLQRISIETLINLFNKLLIAENITAEDEALQLIAKSADGSARDGLSLLDQAISLGGDAVKTEIVQAMIGLADRKQTFDLFASLVGGQIDEVMEKLRNQYTNGANPTTILQDLISITHLIAKIKIIPTHLENNNLSQNEKDFCEQVSPKIGIAILSKIWQMLIKGINELAIAPVQIDALEMILIRIAYSASLPTPLELLAEVKKNSKLAPMVQKSSPIYEEDAKKKYSLDKIEDVIAYLAENKKMMMTYSLKNEVSIEEFSPNYIKMTTSNKINSDFIFNLRKTLEEATGSSWKIDAQKGSLGETLGFQEVKETEENKKNASEYPLVKAILAELRGSKIETIIRKVQESEEDIEIEFNEEIIIE